MAKKKARTKPKAKTKARPKAKPSSARKRASPGKMIVRNNAAVTRKPAAQPKPDTNLETVDDDERTPIAERMAEMDVSHMAVAASASVVATGGSVYMVSKGWLSPKAASGLTMGLGAAVTSAGYYWEQDYAMAAGVGMTAAGGVMLSGQYAVDWYQALERRKAERDAKKKAKDEATESSGDAKNGRRNARRIVIQPQRVEDDDLYDDEYPARAA